MGYCLNCPDEPIFTAVSKPLLTEFGIHHRLESCGDLCSLMWWNMTAGSYQRFLATFGRNNEGRGIGDSIHIQRSVTFYKSFVFKQQLLNWRYGGVKRWLGLGVICFCLL